MPKKKTAKKTTSKGVAKQKQEQAESETVSFLVRLDKEVHTKLKAAAEQADLSITQVIQGICRASAENMKVGEPRIAQGKYVEMQPVNKCIAFGRLGYYKSDEEREWIKKHEPWEAEELPENQPGEVWFSLDYTNRGVKYH